MEMEHTNLTMRAMGYHFFTFCTHDKWGYSGFTWKLYNPFLFLVLFQCVYVCVCEIERAANGTSVTNLVCTFIELSLDTFIYRSVLIHRPPDPDHPPL